MIKRKRHIDTLDGKPANSNAYTPENLLSIKIKIDNKKSKAQRFHWRINRGLKVYEATGDGIPSLCLLYDLDLMEIINPVLGLFTTGVNQCYCPTDEVAKNALVKQI
ncbi:hypothetical protein C5167_016473 [Papaver somniferum]|nr:hypothetical protein C5167_016473 [Papaver somniferum]